MNENIHTFKKLWAEKPTSETNTAFLFWLLKRIENNATFNASPTSAMWVIKDNNALCEDFALTQEHYIKTFKVPYDGAELLDENAFRVFVPSMFKDTNTLEIWECLAWQDWRNKNGSNRDYLWFKENIKDKNLKWREYMRLDEIESEEIEVLFVGEKCA